MQVTFLCLRRCYGMSVTELAYVAVLIWRYVRYRDSICRPRRCYGICGTELACGDAMCSTEIAWRYDEGY
eukprot:2936808-Rhodomonas_salina.1